MKTKFLFGALLASSMLLAGCKFDFNALNYGDSDSDGEGDGTHIDEETKSEWNESDAAILKGVSHDLLIPYIDFAKADVIEYTDGFGTKSAVVQTEEVAAFTEFTGYVQKLKDMGFDMQDAYSTGTVYQGGLEVDLEEGTRYVSIYLEACDEEGQTLYETAATAGLYLAIGDPYFYEFPTLMAQVLADYQGCKENAATIPAFEAERYYYDSDYNAIFAEGANVSAATETAFKEALTEANWTIDPEQDEYGYWYALSPDESYIVAFQYEADYFDFGVYFIDYNVPTTEWSVASYEKYFARYECDLFDVPAFVAAEATFVAEDDEYNSSYIAYGWESLINLVVTITGATSEEYDAYLATLTADGWQLDEEDDGYYTKVVDGLEYWLLVSYDADKTTASVKIYYLPEVVD